MDDHLFWQRVWFWVQLLFVISYATSVAAFLLGLKRQSWRVSAYFSGLFFLALCPFFLLFVATVLRVAPYWQHIDGVANAQQVLDDGVRPLYLGAGTSLVLVALHSLLRAWPRSRRV